VALRNGRRYFGYWPDDSLTDSDTARRHAEVFLDALRGEGFAQPNSRPLFSNAPGLLRVDRRPTRSGRPARRGRPPLTGANRGSS